MSGPSWCSTSFDLAAAPRSCSRSKVPTLGMSLSMTNLRSAMATSNKQRLQLLSYEAFGRGAIPDSLTRQGHSTRGRLETYRCLRRALLDRLVGTREQRRWHVDAKRLGGLQINRKLELDRGLDGK